MRKNRLRFLSIIASFIFPQKHKREYCHKQKESLENTPKKKKGKGKAHKENPSQKNIKNIEFRRKKRQKKRKIERKSRRVA